MHSAEPSSASTTQRLFWKAYVGGGLLTNGNLQDEDFPPGITPYSSTRQHRISRAQLHQPRFRRRDRARPGFRVDAFVGYHYLHQRMKAFGCQQTAANPLVCARRIDSSVAVIVEDDTWQALRLGINADLPTVRPVADQS